MNENILLKNEEKAVFALRSLYVKYGYLPYKMSKFEEYDLYVRNKDFLVSDSVITFNDTNGRLLALKPDVTLSIIKNSREDVAYKNKLCYNENVYRISDSTHSFKEIMQTGIECIGEVDINDIFEVVYLAAKSLDTVSSNFILDISHVGVFCSCIDSISDSKSFKKEITKLVSEKNTHGIKSLCKDYAISEENTDLLVSFVSLYGDVDSTLEKLSKILPKNVDSASFNSLTKLCSLLSKTEFKDRIRIDFSVINDMKYYNGFVFRGFLNGISEGVLSGGEYGNLLRRMGKSGDAIGFAIYMDLLSALEESSSEYDVDVLLVYDTATDAETLFEYKNKIIESGKSVSCQNGVTDKISYKELIDIRGNKND